MDKATIRCVVRKGIRQVMGEAEPENLIRIDARSSTASRTFWTARTEGKDIFVKCAAEGNLVSMEIDSYLSKRFSGTNVVPQFYGAAQVPGFDIGIWEYVRGSSPEFHEYDEGMLRELLQSLAMITIRGRDGPISARTRWNAPSFRRLNLVIARKRPDDERELLKMSRSVARRMDALRGSLAAGPAGLVHNDFRGANVIQRPSQALCIIDWESATYAPVGSSLRVFWNSTRRAEVVDMFSSALAREGMSVTTQQLSSTLSIQQAVWALDTGMRMEEVDRIRRGLRNLLSAPLLTKEGS